MFTWPSITKKQAPKPRSIKQPRDKTPFAVALDMGQELFALHGLTDWRLVLDHARRRAGLCDYRNKTISLSRHYVKAADPDHIKDTLLHEIAHALVGPKHGHDAVWRQKAREIGCTATRGHNLEFSEAKWLMQCPKGCFSVTRHRRKSGLVCAKCKSPVQYVAHDNV